MLSFIVIFQTNQTIKVSETLDDFKYFKDENFVPAPNAKFLMVCYKKEESTNFVGNLSLKIQIIFQKAENN